jgi:mono/diheme cytochrome c family protein
MGCNIGKLRYLAHAINRTKSISGFEIVMKQASNRSFRKAGIASLVLVFAASIGGFAATSQAVAGEGSPDLAEGRQIFTDWGCGTCHALADAGAGGAMGPRLDGNGSLTKDYVVSRISYGQGAMPPFAGSLTDDEIALVADYIVAVAEQ